MINKHRTPCPAYYLDEFSADWEDGVPFRTLQAKYLRPDGAQYNERTIRGWAARAGLVRRAVAASAPSVKIPVGPTPTENVQAAIADEQQRLDTLVARAEERRLLKQAANLDRVVEAFRGEMPRLKPTAPMPPKIKEGFADESVLCFISDVQLGEVVDKDSTSGLGYYNTDAFVERAERYYKAVTRLVEMHRTASNITDLHVLFGGDVVEGTSIYPSQAFNIDLLLVPQVMTAVKTFSEMLSQFATFLGITVHVYGVPGNHGRVARKGAEPYMNNMDTLAYRFMEMYLEKHPGIKWHLSDSWFQLFKVQGHLFATEHGDSVKGSMGIPLYGLIRRHNRLVMMTGEIIEALLIGHHHVPTSAETGFGCRAYINGSWVGTSDYSSHEMGLGSTPSQLLLGINRHHGIVWERHIHLADAAEIRNVPIIDSEAS